MTPTDRPSSRPVQFGIEEVVTIYTKTASDPVDARHLLGEYNQIIWLTN